ncbi:hypothetical protein KAU11_06920 [Candidatus Babeliales bacterium]|nr:hypothetical protein [Candidatus Babeliales bacterium]
MDVLEFLTKYEGKKMQFVSYYKYKFTYTFTDEEEGITYKIQCGDRYGDIYKDSWEVTETILPGEEYSTHSVEIIEKVPPAIKYRIVLKPLGPILVPGSRHFPSEK